MQVRETRRLRRSTALGNERTPVHQDQDRDTGARTGSVGLDRFADSNWRSNTLSASLRTDGCLWLHEQLLQVAGSVFGKSRHHGSAAPTPSLSGVVPLNYPLWWNCECEQLITWRATARRVSCIRNTDPRTSRTGTIKPTPVAVAHWDR